MHTKGKSQSEQATHYRVPIMTLQRGMTMRSERILVTGAGGVGCEEVEAVKLLSTHCNDSIASSFQNSQGWN